MEVPMPDYVLCDGVLPSGFCDYNAPGRPGR